MGKVRQAEAVCRDSVAPDWSKVHNKPQPMTAQVAIPASPIWGI